MQTKALIKIKTKIKQNDIQKKG